MKIKIGNRIIENDCRDFEYYDDLLRLKEMMLELGFPEMNMIEIKEMWETISDKYCAGWLIIPLESKNLIPYLKEIEVK